LKNNADFIGVLATSIMYITLWRPVYRTWRRR